MRWRRGVWFFILAGFLSACAGTPTQDRPTVRQEPIDTPVKVGNPYTVDGITYYPREDPYYDVTGIASWYGPDFHGKLTANGEVYDMNALTAAHTTLPMPSFVRVTNLTNGRTLVLRVNDRGPFKKNRVIDVSRRAAQLLGFEGSGTAQVRVQVVNPDGTPIIKPVDGGLTPVPQRTADNELETETLEPLGDLPEVDETPVQVPVTQQTNEADDIFVQVASFGSEQNAISFAAYLNDLGPTDIARTLVNNAWFYRVRLGAFQTMEDALKALDKVKNLGFSDAHIFTGPSS